MGATCLYNFSGGNYPEQGKRFNTDFSHLEIVLMLECRPS